MKCERCLCDETEDNKVMPVAFDNFTSVLCRNCFDEWLLHRSGKKEALELKIEEEIHAALLENLGKTRDIEGTLKHLREHNEIVLAANLAYMNMFQKWRCSHGE